jgi:hypothetical protein
LVVKTGMHYSWDEDELKGSNEKGRELGMDVKEMASILCPCENSEGITTEEEITGE